MSSLAILEKGLRRKIPVSYSDWRPADQRVYISVIRKAGEQLRWEPSVGPEVGAGRILAWMVLLRLRVMNERPRP